MHNAAFEVISNNRSASSLWHILSSITGMLYVPTHTLTEELQVIDVPFFSFAIEKPFNLPVIPWFAHPIILSPSYSILEPLISQQIIPY
jgi:hypothetical protein